MSNRFVLILLLLLRSVNIVALHLVRVELQFMS
jgi:hypothetical protein